jgi:hypothetical protein
MKVKHQSTINRGDDMTPPHRIVLRWDELKKEWVVHTYNLQDKGYHNGDYFRAGDHEGIATPSNIDGSYKRAAEVYKARCEHSGVMPCLIDRMEVEATFTHFVVVALGYWGKGTTIPEALQKLAEFSGWGKRQMAKEKMLLFWGTEDIEVYTDGSVHAMNLVDLGVLQGK